MRKKGKVVSWKDDKGFGFIRPDDGSKDIFLHVRDIRAGGRPETGRRVEYLEACDKQGRVRAVSAALASSTAARFWGSSIEAAIYSVLFYASLAAVIYVGFLPQSFFWAYLLFSSFSFLMYATDKWRAVRGRRVKRVRRTPEKTLHLLDVLGGWPGGMVAQQMFRHKTTKPSFRLTFWITVALNIAVLCFLISDYGVLWAQRLDVFLVTLTKALLALATG